VTFLRFALLVAAACAACSRPLPPATGIGPDTDAGPAAPVTSAPPSATVVGASAPAAPVASASASPSAARPPGVTSQDEDDLREAVFRYMFHKNASGMQQSAHVFCLHFENGADPPAAFLLRFHGARIPAYAGSACTENASSGVIHRATGKHGLAFRIDAIAWTDADHAAVNGGYYEAGLSASGNVYTLERRHGVWTVTKDAMQWIS
jgi:hypothetical protein